MSGAEAFAVLGVISSIISIVDGSKKVFEAAKDTKGLPEAFREVAGRLPIVESILGSAKQNIEEKGVNNDSRKGVENIVKACKEKAEKLQELFNKVVPGEGASRVERYCKAAKVPGKGHKVEKLMQGILEDVNVLIGEKGINSASKAQQEQILKAIKEIAAVAPSIPEQGFQQTGFTNSNYGYGTQYNAQGENIAQGSARQYNSAGGSMNFATYNDNRTQDISNSLERKNDEANCLEALFLTNPRDDRAKLMNEKGSRVDGTCQWIKSHTLYKSWLCSDSQLLWLSGGPGKGKTMLSIFLAEELEKHAISQNKLFLQYFCDNKDGKRNTAVAVLRGLIYQLLRSRPKLFDHILPDFKIQKTSLFSFETLWRIFKSMVRDASLETTYCVLDGLDECDEASLAVLLREFAALFSAHPVRPLACNLNLLIVSRGLPDFIPNLLSTFRRISLDADASAEVKHDIDIFIEDKVEELSRRRQYPEALREHVAKVFRDRAQGTFLWIGIVAKELEDYNATEAEEVLKTFPSGLDELYARILLQIYRGRQQIAARILRWVVMAVRPLTLSELSFAIEPTIKPSIVPIDRDRRIRDQVSFCGYFLVIKEGQEGQEDQEDQGDEVGGASVGLIHQSAKDYLLRKNQDSNPVLEDFRVKEDVANHEIAKRCLDYLQSGALENSKRYVLTDEEHLSRFPLLSYAVLYWYEHARSLASSVDVFDLSHPFWKKKSELRTSWLKAHWDYYYKYMPYDRPPESFSKLHLASFLGIFSLVEKLVLRKGRINKIKRTRVLNKADSQGMTALMWAAWCGHEDVVLLLLEKGAPTGNKDRSGRTAILLAAESGHEDIVQQLLLEKRANINAQDMFGRTLLMLVATFGDEATIRLLLREGVNVDTQSNFGETALMKATQSRHENVMQILLQQGADVNLVHTSRGTALIMGAKNESLVHLLLKHGAAVNAADESGETALMKAATLGNEAVTQLLLKQGADINVQRRDGATALSLAASMGSVGTAWLLLEYRADVNVADESGETALIKAAKCSYENPEATIRLLLEKGPDINAVDNFGETALMNATAGLSENSEATTRLLLENGADVNATNKFGGTALIRAAAGFHESSEAVLRLLLEKGADVNAADNNGKTALMKVAEDFNENSEAMIRLLLEKGADVNAADNNGKTALMKAAKCFNENSEAMIRLLLEKGADINVPDDSRETALMRAANCFSENSEAAIRLLLEKGADINAADDFGETALMRAANCFSDNSEAAIRLLLGKGADTNAKNRNGKTALAIAVRTREEAEDGRMMALLYEFDFESDAKQRVEVRKSMLDSIIQMLTLHSQTQSSI